LPSVLQDIDDPVRVILKVDRFAVGDEMEIVFARQHFAKTLPHLPLEEAEHAANFLERESLPSELGNYCDLNYFFRCIDALVALVPGGHNFALIPPLQLP
jgi:hypothetical protein